MIRVRVGDLRIEEEERAAVNEVLDSGKISEGPKTTAFEKQFAEFVGTKHSIALSSGTAALIAGLNALMHLEKEPVKEGAKVLTTPLTYIATTNSIVLSKLEPVFIDVKRETFDLDAEKLAEFVEAQDSMEEFSLVLPVHLMGFPCDMDEINKIAKENNLRVFEDSSQAHGSEYKGKKTGSMSELGSFSFYIAHNIQAGELGAVTSNNAEIVGLIRKIKAHGRMCDCIICTRNQGICPQMDSYKGDEDFDPRFTHDMVAYNFKTMDIQAALASTQLKKADWIIKKRQENVKFLNDELGKFESELQLPPFSKDVSYLAYPLVIKDAGKISRKELRYALEKEGVENRPLFGCIPTQQPSFSKYRKQYEDKLPNADYLGKNGFYIGCHQYLSEEDLHFIIEKMSKVLGK